MSFSEKGFWKFDSQRFVEGASRGVTVESVDSFIGRRWRRGKMAGKELQKRGEVGEVFEVISKTSTDVFRVRFVTDGATSTFSGDFLRMSAAKVCQ